MGGFWASLVGRFWALYIPSLVGMLWALCVASLVGMLWTRDNESSHFAFVAFVSFSQKAFQPAM